MKTFTSSLARTARSCRRKFQIEYELGVRPAESALALRFGTLVHLALEAWWRAVMTGLPVDEWLGRALAAMAGEADPFELARAQVMMTGYHLRWCSEAAAFDVLGVELQFEGALINPITRSASRTWRLAGKLDVLVRERATGRIFVIEHKTSSEDLSPGAVYWQKLRMDGQVSIYFEGGRLLGHDVEACVYDVLAKPRHEPREVPVLDENGNKVVLDAQGSRVRTAQGKWRQTGDTAQGYVLQTRPETVDEFRERLAAEVGSDPSKYLARCEVVRLAEEMKSALVDVWQLAQGLQYDSVVGRYPRNPDACHLPGRSCAYWDVCTGVASIEDPVRFRRTELHPELATEAA